MALYGETDESGNRATQTESIQLHPPVLSETANFHFRGPIINVTEPKYNKLTSRFHNVHMLKKYNKNIVSSLALQTLRKRDKLRRSSDIKETPPIYYNFYTYIEINSNMQVF